MTTTTSLDVLAQSPESRDRHADTVSPILLIEIQSGQTRFPVRPVTKTRFLIGSDPACDLRLGGDDVPPLHSLIHADGRDVQLESVVEDPPLSVNGISRHSVRLEEGDVIEIGSFRLVVHHLRGALKEALPQNSSAFDFDPADSDLSAFEEQDLSELSAEELVDRIEQDEQLVQDWERGQQAGADSLWQALAHRIELEDQAAGNQASTVSVQDASAGSSERDIMRDLEQLLVQLNEFSTHLENRSERLSRREHDYADAAEHLLDVQQQLAAHLESLLFRLPEAAIEPRRAIA